MCVRVCACVCVCVCECVCVCVCVCVCQHGYLCTSNWEEEDHFFSIPCKIVNEENYRKWLIQFRFLRLIVSFYHFKYVHYIKYSSISNHSFCLERKHVLRKETLTYVVFITIILQPNESSNNTPHPLVILTVFQPLGIGYIIPLHNP